jgi:hypothetical protein
MNEIIDREEVNKCLNDLIDLILTVDDLVENTTLITTPLKEDLILVQDATEHVEGNIDVEKDESLSSDTQSEPENIEKSISDDELSNIHDLPIEPSDPQDDQTNISDDELSNTHDLPIEPSDPQDDQTNISDDELPNTHDLPTEPSDPQDDQTNISDDESSPEIITVDSLNHPIELENNTITSSNELEGSFDCMKEPESQTHQPSEESVEKFTNLDTLRALISQIEHDENKVDEDLPPKQDVNLSYTDKNDPTEYQDIEDALSSSSSIPDDVRKMSFIESPLRTHSTSDILNEDTSSTAKLPEKKRVSIVNCYFIPPGTKIHHMNCSSTYIYICTNDQKIFYAKINIDLSLKWQQHSDLAEQLVVSLSNRVVWRLSKKHLFSSTDPLKFPPIGSKWNEIKIDNGESLLSMSVNDQCGWYIKGDGTLWLVRADDGNHQSLNVACPFNLNAVVCYSEKVGVTTNDGEILIRIGCTNDCLEGDGWIFIEHRYEKKD